MPIIPDREEETADELTRQVTVAPISGATFMHCACNFRGLGEAQSSSSNSSSSCSSRAGQQPVSLEETVSLVPLLPLPCPERHVVVAETTQEYETIFCMVALLSIELEEAQLTSGL